MRPRLLKACKTVAVASGFLVPTSVASANSVNLTFDQTTSSGPVSVTVNGTSVTGVPGPYYWTAPAGSGFSNPTVTFCTELTQHISTGNSYTYTVTPLASASNLSAAQVTAITELYAQHYSTAWDSKSFAGSDQSTAFQLALWEIVYDGNGTLDLTSGNLVVNSASSTALNTAQTWLSNLGSLTSLTSTLSNEQLVWLSNPWKQDQLTMIPCSPPPPPPPPPPPAGVPAPPGAVLAGVGFLGLLGRSRWLRKSAQS